MAGGDSTPIEQRSEKERKGPLAALQQAGRITSFWARGGQVYFGYKGAQVRAAYLKKFKKWDADRLRDEFWEPHHTWAGHQFYTMAIDLRGFYLKIGQFFAARAEFVPKPICKKLSLLHDQVPPMSAEKTRGVLEAELGGTPMEDVFEWIDLENVLGSASIAQVHKAKLRRRKLGKRERLKHWLASEEPAPNDDGPTHDVRRLWGGGRGRKVFQVETEEPLTVTEAVDRAAADPRGPKDGIVAIKVQYPDALPVMMGDLKQIRRFAGFIQKTEIKFDMLSAVDELAGQVELEFDFLREAGVMDRVADNLKGLEGQVEIPRSVRGLVTRRVLVMNYLNGEQITRLKSRVAGMSPRVRRMAQTRLLHRIADAYGTMIVKSGLFQADPHPGNLLVLEGGKVGLIDYGQSKQLTEDTRLAFARLMVEMSKGKRQSDPLVVSACLRDLGLRFDNDDNIPLQAMMAFGMFDTEQSHKVDPFDPKSPIKKLGIKKFPPDVFFVLRTTQMLRGLAIGMQQPDFSTSKRWKKLAEDALRSA